MRLPKEETFTLAAKLYADNDYDASRRFGSTQFADYYETRLKAEKWLYDNFVSLGGKPRTKHPLYFYVHDWDLAAKFWPGAKIVKIPLDGIESCDICFAFGDSCVDVDKLDRQRFFLKDELMELIASHGGIEKLIAYVKQEIGIGMIEAYLWNDKYVTRESAE